MSWFVQSGNVISFASQKVNFFELSVFVFFRRANQLMREDDDAAVPYCVSLGDVNKV